MEKFTWVSNKKQKIQKKIKQPNPSKINGYSCIKMDACLKKSKEALNLA